MIKRQARLHYLKRMVKEARLSKVSKSKDCNFWRGKVKFELVK